MKILALIPARGGSKRLPRKNLRKLGDRALVQWSIDVTKGIEDICDVLVSTDDPEIAEAGRIGAALVPWLRPSDLATDEATSVDVSLHALDWYEENRGVVDGLLLLQPTSPFRTRATVQRGIDLFKANRHRAVLGVSAASSHPMWCFHIDGLTMRPFIGEQMAAFRSQNLPPAYELNGAFYLIAPDDFRIAKSFFAKNAIPLAMTDPNECLDIDTELDWAVAEAILEGNSSVKKGRPA
jgi:CMP-N,N'-diacetyllegionaminic acid synthase